MNSIEELCVNLAAEKDKLSKHISNIVRVHSEINEAMDIAQAFFDDQKAGEEIVRLLSSAQRELIQADNIFNSLGIELTTYIADLRK